MRRRGKVDRNHAEIVRALRDYGASVQTLAEIGEGCPDLLVGCGGDNFLMEVKDGLAKPSEQKLNECQKQWHSSWRGTVHVVKSAKEAIELLQIAVH